MTCPILTVVGDEGLPQIATITRHRLIASHWAGFMAARYNGAVYLVGSALRCELPRDIDLRVVIADKEFEGRYDLESYAHFPNQPWLDDMAKRNGELARDFRLNADFQVYPASHCINTHEKNPRLLIAAPTDLSHIVSSVAWWYNPPTCEEPTPAAPAEATTPAPTPL